MLIDFTVGNFRSIKEPVTLNMVSAKLTSQDPQVDINNTFQVDDELKLLTSAAMYGANASGKSNVLRALGFMHRFVQSSSKESLANDLINYSPFRLNALTEKQPSFFEVVFLFDGIIYRYGFEVSRKRVETEWLFYSPHKKESRLFIREGNEIKLSRNFKGGKSTISLTRDNALFISVAAQFNSQTALKVITWFNNIGIISGLQDTGYRDFTAKLFSEDESYRSSILKLILSSDVGINGLSIEKLDRHKAKNLPRVVPQQLQNIYSKQLMDDDEILNFISIRNKKNENGESEPVRFEMSDESEGTQKLFLFAGLLINSLRDGKVMVIDEMDARLHTLLTRKLINLFNSPVTNPRHAQLIFATHDTNLLSKEFLRRDQIWFVEKDTDGASHMYSLAEIKVRNDASFENDYMQGKYGGIPFIGDVRSIELKINPEKERAGG